MDNELKKPYEYSREEFYKLIDEHRSGGPCSSQRYNGKIDWKLVEHIKRVEYMSFGVQKWLYEKANNGCSESLWKLEYGYDLYQEVINKHKNEKQSG